jgi:uncharacterized protein YqgC (DUF456 family)
MEELLLALALIAGLLLIPLGLPGLWLMVGAALLYSYANPGISIWTIGALTVLALVAELIEFTLSARYARKYGGSRRAGWGAILGGVVGAFVWTPLPVIGPMIGAFAGAFVGAWLAEKTKGTAVGGATRVATGALLGRIVAVAMKVGIGLVLAVWILLALWI